MTIIILSIISVILLIAIYCSYISVIKAKNKVKEAASSVDVQLKKRFDLIPNILKIANKFMQHEKSLMEEIVKLRNEAVSIAQGSENINRKMLLDKEIENKLAQFKVAVENYPELKSDKTMVEAIEAYNDTEEHIAAARRFYNSAVNELNNIVEIFPTSIFAALMGIKTAEFFHDIENHEKKSIDASEYLK